MMRVHKQILACFLLGHSVIGTVAFAETINFSPTQLSQAKITTTKLLPATQAHSNLTLNGQAVWSSQAQSTIAAPVSGIIQQLSIENLQTISAGQTIATLHSPQLLTWQSELLQAQAQRDLAAQHLQREQQLFNEGIIAEKRIFEARNALTMADVSLKQKQQLMQLVGKVAGKQLDPQLTIKANQSGVVSEVLVSQGQQVEAGTPLVKLVRNGQLWLQLQATPAQAQQIRVGNAVQVAGCATGQVKSLANGLTANTQTRIIQVSVPQAQQCLQPLQYVSAQVLAQSSNSQGWTVPSQALVKQNNQWYVFKQTAQGFEPIAVNILSQSNKQTLIDGQALQANMPIAITGLVQIKAAWSGMGGE
ncbi:efflux RND transporter periplasmic adaptor subunit [Agitococcus lubricus]|nr:efflux RND transporter periplasmic adaptor subunit [Agitococcus lubricus]